MRRALFGRRLGRRHQMKRALGHPNAIAACRCPTPQALKLGSNRLRRPWRYLRSLVDSRAFALSFAPKQHDKDHAHHGQKWRYQFHPRIPLHLPLWARECKNVVIGARSQVGLIRHADQEINVRPGPDRSSPYWVTPGRGGSRISPRKTKKPRCRFRSGLSYHRWQSERSPIPRGERLHAGDWDALSKPRELGTSMGCPLRSRHCRNSS